MKLAKITLKKAWNSQFAVSDIVGIAFLASIIIGLPYFVLFAKEKLIVDSDVVSFITGAKMVRSGVKGEIYDLPTQHFYQNQVVAPFVKENALPFKNFPIFILPFIPFTFLPLRLSYTISAFFNLAILLLFVFVSAKTFKRIKEFRLWFLAPFVFLPNILTIILGQLSIILAFTYLLIYKLLKENKAVLAGVFSGFLFLKPQYIVAVPFFFLLAKKRLNFLKGFLMVFLILILSTFLISGPDALLKYPSFLLLTENESFSGHTQRMFTLSSTLYYILPIRFLSFKAILILNALLYFLFYCLFIKRYKIVNFDYAFASATILSLLFAVHVLEHDLAILLVPIMLLINSARYNHTRNIKLIIIGSLLFLMPLIVLLVSPVVGTLLSFTAAFILLSKENKLTFA